MLDFRDLSAEVLASSPRAAAALLRLGLEKLCRHLVKTGCINKMIGDPVKDGLSVKVQQALDVVRVVGNEAVHPGSMKLKDDQATAATLFQLLNIVVERMISEERHIGEIFASLPAAKLKGIENRDKPKD